MHTHAVAMHMSDGLVNGRTSLLFAAVAVVALAFAVTRARADLDDRTAPMAGLVTAFVFAVQMAPAATCSAGLWSRSWWAPGSA